MKKQITFVKEDSRLDVGAIIYWSQKYGTEMRTADQIPENLGFFQTEKQLKKILKKIAKEEFILPIRMKICIR